MDLFKTKQGEEIECLQQENDELRALLDDYKDFAGLVDFDEKVVAETISKIKADAINQAVMSHRNDESFKATFDVLCCHGFMFEYADKLEQDNERD